ncbi:hypothetical protein SAMN05421837_103326 [Amycolatopsis pretoriensis]|uniref:Extracellular repeat, HAF family n=1 Tax=Amycolatopsis pretoriensis TaxID=218821 RepID=A0A1H5QKT4_9PSEU|nr:hypothetical protein [Amycolatopsis pretoriensis]SEF26454.1 hypothetical protein SAMN05421837_103326 [Amycolatopsis pretoriensis]
MNLFKRTTAAGLAGLALAVVPAVPAAADPAPPGASCTWRAEPVPVPPFAEPRSYYVDATDGEGNFSGRTFVGQSAFGVVLWEHGEPRQLDLPEGFDSAVPAGQTRSGTVLVNATSFATTPATQQIFLYRNGTYEPVRLPAGYRNARADAINDRGDVVATASVPGGSVVILWSVLAAGPIVISPPELPWASAVDIDEDGTILLGDGYSAYLWRSGTLTPQPPSPGTPVLTREISNGTAVGTVLDPAGPKAVLWSQDAPHLLDGGGEAESVNHHGTIAGRLGAWDGPPAVWQGTSLVAKLPLPAGAASASADLIGDDGTVFGRGDGDTGPVRWRCGS